VSTITFTVCVGVRGPIAPGEYFVGKKRLQVSYPSTADSELGVFELPKSHSTLFVVSWEDRGQTEKQLRSPTYEQHLPIYDVLHAISELLLVFKLSCIGNADSLGVRTVGIADALFYRSEIDEVRVGPSNIGLKNYEGNNAWLNTPSTNRQHGDKTLNAHIGTDTFPMARKYVRCYELLETGFYTEAFIVAFAALDDFIQQSLQTLLKVRGLAEEAERSELLRGIKEHRLKIYLGPLLKLVFGRNIYEMWPGSVKALAWLNSTRNDIAHDGRTVDGAAAAKGIYACLKVLVVLNENGVAPVEITVNLFRHAKITAAWTLDPPDWVPTGQLAESMDFCS
jgi:hypothetical protein